MTILLKKLKEKRKRTKRKERPYQTYDKNILCIQSKKIPMNKLDDKKLIQNNTNRKLKFNNQISWLLRDLLLINLLNIIKDL